MKRIISAILFLCVLTSALSVGVFAANDATEMQGVLNKVKSKISIPSEYSDFEYSKSDDRWYFTWRNEETGQIEITSDHAGRIFSYDKRTYETENVNNAPKILKTEAGVKANDFLKKAVPEAYAQLDFKNAIVTSYRQGYRLNIYRVINGHPCVDHLISAVVNYQTGEVTQFFVTWDYAISFPTIANPIPVERAKEIWQENTKMDLFYRIKTTVQDDGKVENCAYLVYSPEEETDPIDAENGKLITEMVRWEQNTNDSASGGGMTEASQDKNSGIEYLTEDEIKKTEEYAGLLSMEEAKKIVAGYPELSLSKDFTFSEGALFKSYRAGIAKEDDGSEFEWRLKYRSKVTKGEVSNPGIYVTVNAKSGNIVNYRDVKFSELSKKHTVKAVVSKQQAKATVQNFLKKAQPERFSTTEYVESDYNPYQLEDSKQPYAENFSFMRVNEKIRVEYQGMDVCVDYATGKIVSMNCNWTDNVKFDNAADKISIEAARDAYLNSAEPELCYQLATTYYYDVEKQNAKDSEIILEPDAPKSLKAILTYRFTAASENIAAKDGTLLDYAGEAIEKTARFTEYQDLKNVSNAREIALLADIGVLPQEENFTPREKVMQKEFIDFLMKAMEIDSDGYYYYRSSSAATQDYNYELAKRYGIIKEDEVAPNRELSRYDAVLFSVRAAGYGKLCEDASIFKVNYSDAASIPSKYLGAVAIAKTTKIYVAGGASFYGNDVLARADAAHLIYSYLTRDKK